MPSACITSCRARAASTIWMRWTRWPPSSAALHPNSPFRLQAVLAAANRYLTENKVDQYEPLYRACFESFPQDKQAAGCHWKVAWVHYLRRESDAAEMLRAHLRLFPASENASAALYFLGRLAEQSRDRAAARAYYEEIAREYPNQYYAMLARDRLTPVATCDAFSRRRRIPAHGRIPAACAHHVFDASAASQARIERAKLLVSAGLKDWAEIELRYGAQTGDQPHLLAMELARADRRRPARAGHPLHQELRRELFVPADRLRAARFLAAGVSAALSRGSGALLQAEQSRSVSDGRADPAGIRVRRQGHFARQCARSDADRTGHRPRAEPQTEDSRSTPRPSCSSRR